MQKVCENFCGSYDLKNLSNFAGKICKNFANGVIILQGDLASGKTTLVKAICKALNKNSAVTSPTFSLMQDYNGVFHYDLYRVSVAHILQNGLFENFFEDGLHLVEWGDENLAKLLQKYEIPLCIIKISPTKTGRKYEVSFA